MIANGRLFSCDNQSPFLRQRTGTGLADIDLIVLKRSRIDWEVSSSECVC
jgi:hypothetical protein